MKILLWPVTMMRILLIMVIINNAIFYYKWDFTVEITLEMFVLI